MADEATLCAAIFPSRADMGNFALSIHKQLFGELWYILYLFIRARTYFFLKLCLNRVLPRPKFKARLTRKKNQKVAMFTQKYLLETCWRNAAPTHLPVTRSEGRRGILLILGLGNQTQSLTVGSPFNSLSPNTDDILLLTMTTKEY